ncbi:phage portal protein [Microvirga vignae]|uniref:phage portal protein n=1 Tax=Microvirga vignae TaxID=1225564 RepID=UPI000699EE85|nr:phage portal protein [Microvirga vignae]
MAGNVRFRIKGTAVYVDPVAAVPAHIRANDSSYLTAGSGPRSRAWRPPNVGPNAALDYAADALRSQSRDQIRKNPLAGAIVERLVTNLIGSGIKPKFEKEEHQKLWTKWTDEAVADGQLDFYGFQAQQAGGMIGGGEVFVRLRARRPQDGLSVPLQLEALEAEFCPMDKNEAETDSRGEIRQGIEFDKNVKSRRVAYWLYPRHPKDGSFSLSVNEAVRVPASEVLHLYVPSRPGQIRGEPWLTRALARVKDLESYDSAELVRKKVVTMFAGFIRRQLPEGLTLEDLQELYGDAEDAGGAALAGIEPGSMQVLLPGEEIEFSNPTEVGGMYEVYMRQQIRFVATAVGLLYEQLSGDYSDVNDRTWRAAVTDFRRRMEQLQHQIFVFQFCRPVARRWAELALISGAAADIDPSAPVTWTPPRWPYINPLQDVQTQEREVQAGFTSRARVVSERGEDVEQIDAEQEADNKRADAAGLKHTSDGRAQANKQIGHNGGPPLDDPGNEPAPGSRRKKEK